MADVASFPPTVLVASTDEVLLDDAVAMASALARARVRTATSFVPGAPHAWPSVAPDDPESAATLELIAQFVGRLPSYVPKEREE
jgi:acetyl esterase/lipase